MLVIPSAIVTSDNLLQLLNAEAPMPFAVEGIFTLVISPRPVNAPSPMPRTPVKSMSPAIENVSLSIAHPSTSVTSGIVVVS